MGRAKRKKSAKLQQQQQQQQKDFEKKKKKLGSKSRTDNFTDTTVKTRQIHIPNQSRATPTPTPSPTPTSSLTGLTLSDLLGRATHHNTNTRVSALNAMYNATFNMNAISHTAVHTRAAAVAGVAGAALSDDSSNVRSSALNVLSAVMSTPLLPAIGAHVLAALTHLRKDVRLHAARVINRLSIVRKGKGHVDCIAMYMPTSPLPSLAMLLNNTVSAKQKIEVLDAVSACIRVGDIGDDDDDNDDDDDDDDDEVEQDEDLEDDTEIEKDKGDEEKGKETKEETKKKSNKDSGFSDNGHDHENHDEVIYFFNRDRPMSSNVTAALTTRQVSGVTPKEWRALLRAVCACITDALPGPDNHNNNNTSCEDVLKSGTQALSLLLLFLKKAEKEMTVKDGDVLSAPKWIRPVLEQCAKLTGDHKMVRACCGSLADAALYIGDIELCTRFVKHAGTTIRATKRLLRHAICTAARTKRNDDNDNVNDVAVSVVNDYLKAVTTKDLRKAQALHRTVIQAIQWGNENENCPLYMSGIGNEIDLAVVVADKKKMRKTIRFIGKIYDVHGNDEMKRKTLVSVMVEQLRDGKSGSNKYVIDAVSARIIAGLIHKCGMMFEEGVLKMLLVSAKGSADCDKDEIVSPLFEALMDALEWTIVGGGQIHNNVDKNGHVEKTVALLRFLHKILEERRKTASFEILNSKIEQVRRLTCSIDHTI